MDFSSSSLHPRSEDSWILERMREGELKDLMIKLDLRLIDESIIEDPSPEWGEKWTVSKLDFFALRANSSSDDHRVSRTPAEELTAFGVECEGQRTITVGVVLGDVAVICAELFTAVLNLLLQLVTNRGVEIGTVDEESGQEASVERHDQLMRRIVG